MQNISSILYFFLLPAALSAVLGSSALASEGKSPVAKRVIDVLVVATDEAIKWAGEREFACSKIVTEEEGEEFDWLAYEQARKRAEPNVVDYYQDIDINDIKHHVYKVSSLFGLQHPCQGSFKLGQVEPRAGLTIPERNLVYTYNLIQISLAETTKIFANSGIDNVEFRLVGWKVSSDRGVSGDKEGAIVSYPDISGYRAFGNPWPKHANVGIEVAARIAKVASPIRGEVVSLRNLSYPGRSEQESQLDRVHQYRKDHQADVVVMLTRRRKSIIGEASWIGIESADNAYAWASIGQATAPQYTFAHELAHLFGGGHYGNESILGASFDTHAPVADFEVDAHGNSFADNQGFIGEYLHKTADDWEIPYYYGTLLAKFADCQNYIGQLSQPISPSPCSAERDVVFNYNYVFLPVIANINRQLQLPSGKVLDLGKKFSRNNARTIANAIERFTRFDEDFAAKKMSSAKKIGIDFGRKYEGWTDYRTKSDVYPFWNNMTEIESYRAYVNLIYQNGSRSGIRAVITSGFDKSVVASTLTELSLSEGGVADMPVMAMTDGFSTRSRGSVKLENLKSDGVSYHLRIFSSASTHSHYRPTRVTVLRGSVGNSGSEAEKPTLIYNTQLNTNQFFVFEGVIPDEEGVIEFEIAPDDPITLNNREVSDFPVNLNALELFEDTGLTEKHR